MLQVHHYTYLDFRTLGNIGLILLK